MFFFFYMNIQNMEQPFSDFKDIPNSKFSDERQVIDYIVFYK